MDKFQLKIAEELFKTLKSPKEKAELIRKCFWSYDMGDSYLPLIPQWAGKRLHALVTRDLPLSEYIVSTIWTASLGTKYE